MEDGGDLNLYKFLRAHMKQGLDFERSISIITQCVAGICHMHLGPKVAHCDLKCENLLVCMRENGFTIKLCDFDSACVTSETELLSTPPSVSTFPFAAPEIFAGGYNAFLADIWSMGVVMLEVVCGLSIVEK